MNDDLTRIVDGLIERISTAGLIDPNGFRGCLDSELDDLARYLKLPLPAAYRRVLRQCGHFEGYTFLAPAHSAWRSTYFEVIRLHSMVRTAAYVGVTSTGETAKIIPDGWLVFRCLYHPTKRFHCLDTKLGDNPPVFEVTHRDRGRRKRPAQIAERFTDYLSDWIDEGIKQRQAQLALHGVTTDTIPTPQFTGRHARVFELLANIKQRPSMFIPNLQLSQLETYLHGFESGLAAAGQCDWKSAFSREFSAFVEKRCGWSMCSGWAFGIREETPTDASAWQVFFELVDEFRDSPPRKRTRSRSPSRPRSARASKENRRQRR